MAGFTDPDAGVAIRTAEVFAQLVALDVGARGHDGSISVEADDHVADIDCVVAELSAPPSREGLFLCGDLTERGDRDIVIGQRALRKLGVTAKAGLFRLAFHLDDLANRVLIAGVDYHLGANRDMLRRERG
jgi:hypothetical protein